MNILVFGASGATGLHLVQQGLERNYSITAFVRNPSAFKIWHKRLTIVKGNVNDYATVEKAVKGKDAVLSAIGANNMFVYDPVVVNGMANIIKAMELNDTVRLIYLSTLMVKESRKDAGFLIKRVASNLLRSERRGHEEREKQIRQSELLWTIVQAPVLTNGVQKKVYRIGENLKTNAFAATISRADVAHSMLEQLTRNDHVRKAIRLLP